MAMITGVYSNVEFPSVVTVLDEWGSPQEPRVELDVKSLCGTCDFAIRHRSEPHPWILNSHTRIMHVAGEDEYTVCGRKATEQQWLWQL